MASKSFIVLVVILGVALALLVRPPLVPPLPKRGAIVVSGAGSGIGLHVASRLAKEFPLHPVYGIIRPDDSTAEMKKQQMSANGIFPILLDITDEPNAVLLTLKKVNKVAAFFGSAADDDIVVPNVPIEFMNVEHMRQIYNANVFGLVTVLQALLPKMRKLPSGGARIVLMSSAAATGGGTVTTPSFMGMDPARAIETVADSLRREVKKQRISVSVVQAGSDVASSTNVHRKQEMDRGILEEHGERVRKFYPSLFDDKVYSEESMSSMNMVADAVVDAIRNERPQIRYLLGSVPRMPHLPMRFSVTLLNILPHHIVDLLFD